LPLGLSLEHGRQLSRLVQSEDWQAYIAIVQSRYSSLAEGLMDCKDFATYQKVLGGLKAYEEMVTLPDLVIAKLEELRDRTDESGRNTRIAADEYRAHRFGSRYWSERPVEGA